MNKTRVIYLDLLKIMAAIFVVFNHYSYFVTTNSFFSNIVMTIMFVICKVAVPIFIMVSGALILSKKITYKEIFTKRIFRIIVPLFIVSIIFTFEYSGGINFNNILLFILSLFMDTGNNFIPYWLWYLYALIGLYIMTPFLKKMVLKFDKKDYKMFILFFVIGVGVLNLISSIILVFFGKSYAFNSSFMNTIFSNTVGLYVLGYYLYNNKVSDKLKNYSWIILICSLIFGVIFTYYGVFYKGYIYNDIAVWWNLFTVLASGAIFVLFKYYFSDLKLSDRLRKFVYEFSNTSFGIYLIHPLLYEVLMNASFINAIILKNTILGCLSMCIIGITTISIFVWLLRKIPLFRKFL